MRALLAPRLQLLRQEQSLGAREDLEHGLELLGRARDSGAPALLRLYRPQPTVAFGQRDARLPGFAAASEAVVARGFTPAVRRAGGRAAAYHQGCLIVDHIQPDVDAIAAAKARFAFFGELFTRALRGLGLEAAVGEVPGEYCPGEFSVHGVGAGGAVKLVGTAQRVVSGAWLFSSVVVVQDAAPLREVLVDVYRELGLDWDPATAGACADLVPGVTVDAVEAALLTAYADHTEISGGPQHSQAA